MDKKEIVQKLYTLFQSRVYSGSRIEKIKDTSLNKFLSSLDKKYGYGSVGVNFLLDYFSFQYNYWSQLDPERNPNSSWIIGNKAIKRWFDKPDNYSYFSGLLRRKYRISIDHVIEHHSGSNQNTDLDDTFRKRCSDPNYQLLHCSILGLSYSFRSSTCITCSHRKKCKES